MVNENGQLVDEKRDILEEIAEYTRDRIGILKGIFRPAEVEAQARAMEKGNFPFETALRAPGISFICEVKKASPSKGLIAPDFPYVDIAMDYEDAGASAISCLTEPGYFQGQDAYLEAIAQRVEIPVLRKDFFVEPYMIYQAKILGASAILLICAMLSDEELQSFFEIANSLGLSAIFEAHDEGEVRRALACGARIIGVNNRNLKTFQLDLQTSVRLRKLVPPEVLFISESGIKTRADMKILEDCGVDAVLIGETLMRSPHKRQALNQLKGLPHIKLCGLSRLEDITAVNDLDVEYVGFVFAKSRRQVSAQTAETLRSALRSDIQAVGVFVNASLDEILTLLTQGIIQVVQLHGQEDNGFIQALRMRHPNTPIWKAVSMTETVDFTAIDQADCFVLDNGAGGTGQAFDWALLDELDIPKPFFIAGGLSPAMVGQVLGYCPQGVDVSGGVETDGVKDPLKLQEFVKNVRIAP